MFLKDVGRRLGSFSMPWTRVMSISNALLAAALAAILVYALLGGRWPYALR